MSSAVCMARLVCIGMPSSCPAEVCEGAAAVAFDKLELDEPAMGIKSEV